GGRRLVRVSGGDEGTDGGALRRGRAVGMGSPEPAAARDPDAPRQATPGCCVVGGGGVGGVCWYPDGRGTYAKPFQHTFAALERPAQLFLGGAARARAYEGESICPCHGFGRN